MQSTHSHRLERWLSSMKVEEISRSMRGWYGPPLFIGNVPGGVWATGDGDFIGRIDVGQETSWLDRFEQRFRRSRTQLNTGFTSVADFLSQGRSQRQELPFYYASAQAPLNVNQNASYWYKAGQPAAGSTSSAAPGGRNPTTANGGFPFNNANSGDTTHLVGATIHTINTSPSASSAGSGCLLLYDRLFDVNKSMSSTATESVTGTISRYNSTTSGAADSVAGNFLFIETSSGLSNTAHNWTPCTYTDQNAAAQTLPSVTGIAIASQGTLDMVPSNSWWAPLAAGSIGIRSLTAMQCSASVSGGIVFVIGHPIAMFPMNFGGIEYRFDALRGPPHLMPRVYDNACLHFLVVSTTSVSTVIIPSGKFTLVQG